MGKIITLTTDFGLKDPYQGAMKGAILSINPDASIIDITHLISPGSIVEGAYILLEAYGFFPKGTIHVGVVDPGVGGERKPVLIETERYSFVGPDNGLFSLIAEKEKVKRVVHITSREYFLKDVSNTFHGRDIFGPVAAHLSLGAAPSAFGEEIKKARAIEFQKPAWKNGLLEGAVIYVDSFGNLITNIKKEDIPENADLIVGIKGHIIKGLKKTYSSAEAGSLMALIGGSNHLEIAVNAGAASKLLNAAAGERVTVRVLER